MSSYAVEPGTRIVDRYRLEENLEVADGTSYWRAHDELLDRPVGLCLLPADADRAERVLSAARRAAVLTDARFLRVLDASAVDGVVYVVSEWVSADSLVDLLADGPLPRRRPVSCPSRSPPRSRPPTGPGSRTSASSPSTCCAPPTASSRSVAWPSTPRSAVVDVPDEAGAARADTEGAAAVAYAALTARWPGAEHTGLARGALRRQRALHAAPGPGRCPARPRRRGLPGAEPVRVQRAGLVLPGGARHRAGRRARDRPGRERVCR